MSDLFQNIPLLIQLFMLLDGAATALRLDMSLSPYQQDRLAEIEAFFDRFPERQNNTWGIPDVLASFTLKTITDKTGFPAHELTLAQLEAVNKKFMELLDESGLFADTLVEAMEKLHPELLPEDYYDPDEFLGEAQGNDHLLGSNGNVVDPTYERGKLPVDCIHTRSWLGSLWDIRSDGSGNEFYVRERFIFRYSDYVRIGTSADGRIQAITGMVAEMTEQYINIIPTNSARTGINTYDLAQSIERGEIDVELLPQPRVVTFMPNPLNVRLERIERTLADAMSQLSEIRHRLNEREGEL